MTSAPLRPDLSHAWMQVVGLTGAQHLRRRLEWDGLSAEDLAAVMQSPPPPAERDRFPDIQAWLTEAPPIVDGDALPPESFGELWRRIASGAMTELLKTLPDGVIDYFGLRDLTHARDGVRAALHDQLVRALSTIGEPALWQEFNARRRPEQIVYAHLSGNAHGSGAVKRTIYCQLLEELRSDALAGLADSYPVLRRHLSTVVAQWERNCHLTLVRVFEDRLLLTRFFAIPPGARVIELTLGISDPHRGGQTVSVLTFAAHPDASGRWKVVYKPKDLEMDSAFQDLLTELAPPAPSDHPLRPAAVLARDGYGYMEFIPHRVCTNDEQLRAFYRNSGRLTAILYILGCTDCHHENLVACGEQLHIVDAETLFAGCLDEDADDLNARVANSVVSLGILPQWHLFGKRRIARDVTALGFEPPQEKYERVRAWVDINTDGMIVGEQERPALLPASLPVGVGSRNRFAEFIDDFCDGFKDELASIASRKMDWLGEDGYLARFEGMWRRVVVRPTWIYSWLRQRQLEPSALTSQQNQRLVLETLSRSYLLRAEKPHDWPLFGAEVEQMAALDVPFFEMPVDGTDLTLANGSVVVDLVTTPGRENARRKIVALDQASIGFQIDLIRGACSAKSHHLTTSPHRPHGPQRPNDAAESVPLRLDALAEADLIGQQLVDASWRYGDGSVDWLATDIADDLEKFKFGPLGPSLYGGTIGIAIFLAALSRWNLSRSDAYAQLAVRVCADLSTRLLGADAADQARWWRSQPLGLAGSGGILLGLIQLADLLPDPELVDRLVPVVGSCDDDLVAADYRLDIVFGCAGLIGPLLRLGSERALHLAVAAGQVLVDRQDASGGWMTIDGARRPLTGFSHGASGIAAALMALYRACGQPRFREAAERAVRYERGTFDPARGNWPDFRSSAHDHGAKFALSWCHGAPGIALARMCIGSLPGLDHATTEELDHALGSASAVASGPLADSLCCGRLGRAAILRLGAAHRADSRWLAAAAALEQAALQSKLSSGSYSGTSSFGLFSGVAGVGLALLQSLPEARSAPSLIPALLSSGLYQGTGQPAPVPG